MRDGSHERKQGCARAVKVAVHEAPESIGPSYAGSYTVLRVASAKRFATPRRSVGRADGKAGPQLPCPRGPISHALLRAISGAPGPFTFPALRTDDALTDEDLQLALYCCYELHYQGFARVSDEWEWNPALLRLRSHLEQAFEQALRATLTDDCDIAAADVPDALWQLTRQEGFSLSRWLLKHGSRFHAARGRDTPLRLSTQGSRSPYLDDSSSSQSVQGCHGDDPVG